MNWEVLSQPPCSPDIAPSDDHLFGAIQNDLSSQHFKFFENIEKKIKDFYWREIHSLRER